MFAKERALLTDEKSDRIRVLTFGSPAIASFSHTLKKSDRPLSIPINRGTGVPPVRWYRFKKERKAEVSRRRSPCK
ncbi:hypothetical protein [Microcoleus sp. MON2_D5]|uniref:hypothetical protein n=1 Tax=Microcoleus sp. MON2_D5 TaxID=2818833 RepID=UPI002FD54934